METPKQPQIRRIYCSKLNRCPPPDPPPLWLDLGQTGAFLRTKIPCKILWSLEPGFVFGCFLLFFFGGGGGCCCLFGFFFQVLSSIRHNLYVSIKKRRKKESDFSPGGGGPVPRCPGYLRSASPPFRARSLPVCSMSPRYSGHGAAVIHCLFGRERGGGSEGESE